MGYARRLHLRNRRTFRPCYLGHKTHLVYVSHNFIRYNINSFKTKNKYVPRNLYLKFFIGTGATRKVENIEIHPGPYLILLEMLPVKCLTTFFIRYQHQTRL
jgi:hypothetical protein